jgi:outer membrane receptor for ferrienterochelin and colicins
MFEYKNKKLYPLQQALLLSLLTIGFATQVAAADDDFYNLSLAELGRIQIAIATGNDTPVERVPASASVISAAEIESMGARTLDEVLGSLAGFHVAPSVLSRLDIIYSVRGIHTGFNPQVLLLMNAIPVQFSLQGGRPTLFRLPISSVERIEVIRGPVIPW